VQLMVSHEDAKKTKDVKGLSSAQLANVLRNLGKKGLWTVARHAYNLTRCARWACINRRARKTGLGAVSHPCYIMPEEWR
jgi:hypothetical protein